MPAVVVVIIVLKLLKLFAQISIIGLPRKPVAPGDVLVLLTVDCLLILWCIRTFLYQG